jgi:hypothetical protein
MPLTPVGFPFRAFPFQGYGPPLGRPCPPVVPLLAPSFRRRTTRGRSRLQGLAPLGSPLPPARCLGSPVPDTLLGFCPSRVLPLPAVEDASNLLPSCPWRPVRRSGPLAWTPGFYLAGSPAGLRRDCRPFWGFPPSEACHRCERFGGPGLLILLKPVIPSPEWLRLSWVPATSLPEPDGSSFR